MSRILLEPALVVSIYFLLVFIIPVCWWLSDMFRSVASFFHFFGYSGHPGPHRTTPHTPHHTTPHRTRAHHTTPPHTTPHPTTTICAAAVLPSPTEWLLQAAQPSVLGHFRFVWVSNFSFSCLCTYEVPFFLLYSFYYFFVSFPSTGFLNFHRFLCAFSFRFDLNIYLFHIDFVCRCFFCVRNAHVWIISYRYNIPGTNYMP